MGFNKIINFHHLRTYIYKEQWNNTDIYNYLEFTKFLKYSQEMNKVSKNYNKYQYSQKDIIILIKKKC